jgi:hypothetical protein
MTRGETKANPYQSPVPEDGPRTRTISRRKLALAIVVQLVACWIIAGLVTPVDVMLEIFSLIGCVVASITAASLTLWVVTQLK